MNQRLFVAILSALVFASGLAGGMWIERHRPLPPPPVPLGVEFEHGQRGAEFSPGRNHRLNRAELIARIESLRPQLEAFHARYEEAEAEFDRGMDLILTPDQRQHRAVNKSHHEREIPKGEGPPLSDEKIIDLLREQPARTILWDVVIPFRLDFLTQQYSLDDAQREKVRALLRVRREKLLELVDSSPPPSVMLSRLAPLVQRLAEPPAKAASVP